MLKLRKATPMEVRYACLTFHYAKSVPTKSVAYSVFNSQKEFCGCIVYSHGANRNIGNPYYGLNQKCVLELVRVALNGKQGQGLTSKAVSISMKLVAKEMPWIKLLISYADSEQEHVGIIYQATNWIYVGDAALQADICIDGKVFHKKSITGKYGTCNLAELRKKLPGNIIKTVLRKAKLKYIYPLSDSIKPLCKSLSKPYPKRAPSNVDSECPSEEGGVNPTRTLQ